MISFSAHLLEPLLGLLSHMWYLWSFHIGWYHGACELKWLIHIVSGKTPPWLGEWNFKVVNFVDKVGYWWIYFGLENLFHLPTYVSITYFQPIFCIHYYTHQMCSFYHMTTLDAHIFSLRHTVATIPQMSGSPIFSASLHCVSASHPWVFRSLFVVSNSQVQFNTILTVTKLFSQ